MGAPGKGSYTGLYYWAVSLQRRALVGSGAILAILVFAFFLGEPLYRYVVNPQVDRLAKTAATVAFLTLVGMGIYFILLLFLVLTLSRSPTRPVLQLAARLLLEAGPYDEQNGITLNDIYRLKRIAEIEQRSASWRGNFLNSTAFGLVVLILIALPAMQFFFIPFLGQNFSGIFASSSWPDWNIVAADAGGMVGIAIVSLIALWLAGRWVGYIIHYVSSETANRVILLACEEIISLFGTIHIHQRRQLAFRERRAIIERFGCRLVPSRRAGLVQWPNGPKPFEIRMHGKSYGSWMLIYGNFRQPSTMIKRGGRSGSTSQAETNA